MFVQYSRVREAPGLPGGCAVVVEERVVRVEAVGADGSVCCHKLLRHTETTRETGNESSLIEPDTETRKTQRLS